MTSVRPKESLDDQGGTESGQGEYDAELLQEEQVPTSFAMTIFAPGVPPHKRVWALLASLGINLGLPFVNGMMLGLGEIFARTWIAPTIGLGVSTRTHRNATGTANTTTQPTESRPPPKHSTSRTISELGAREIQELAR